MRACSFSEVQARPAGPTVMGLLLYLYSYAAMPALASTTLSYKYRPAQVQASSRPYFSRSSIGDFPWESNPIKFLKLHSETTGSGCAYAGTRQLLTTVGQPPSCRYKP
jgi:hypothetical protein